MLTDTLCKNARCPDDKPRARFADSHGLYLEVAHTGAKRWFWKYKFSGKEKRLALGSYIEASSKAVGMTLKQARQARDDARRLHQTGTDPAQRRQLDKLEREAQRSSGFEAVAREFHAAKVDSLSPRYSARWLERMEKDLFPWIGSLPLSDISAPLLLKTLRRVEARGASETAHTLRQTAGQVFRYGIATGRCERNPAPDLQGALKPIHVKHMAAVLEPDKAGDLMRAIAHYGATDCKKLALEQVVRPGSCCRPDGFRRDLCPHPCDQGVWARPTVPLRLVNFGPANPHINGEARGGARAARPENIGPFAGWLRTDQDSAASRIVVGRSSTKGMIKMKVTARAVATAIMTASATLSGTVLASPIMLNFGGTVTQTSFDPFDRLSGAVVAGSSFYSYLNFDTNAVDAAPSPNLGSYTLNGSPYGFEPVLGSVRFPLMRTVNISIVDGASGGPDQYSVFASEGMAGGLGDYFSISILLQDDTGAAFSSDALYAGVPDLARFSIRIAGGDLVIENIVTANGAVGLALQPTAGYRGNSLLGNGQGPVSGGVSIGPNICGYQQLC